MHVPSVDKSRSTDVYKWHLTNQTNQKGTEKPKKQKTKNTRSEIIREQTVDEEALLCVRDNTHRQATEWYVYWL